MKWEAEQKTQPVQGGLVTALDYSLSSSVTYCKAICQGKELYSVPPNLLQNPLFAILFKQFPGTPYTHQLNHVHQQGQTFAKKIKNFLVVSFWNE